MRCRATWGQRKLSTQLNFWTAVLIIKLLKRIDNIIVTTWVFKPVWLGCCISCIPTRQLWEFTLSKLHWESEVECFTSKPRFGLVLSYNQAERSLCAYKALKAKLGCLSIERASKRFWWFYCFLSVPLLARSHFMQLQSSLIQALHSLQTQEVNTEAGFMLWSQHHPLAEIQPCSSNSTATRFLVLVYFLDPKNVLQEPVLGKTPGSWKAVEKPLAPMSTTAKQLRQPLV